MPQGLPRKLRIAFIVQAVLVSLAIVLGVYLVSAVIKHSLMNTALQEEASHFWQLYSASTSQPPPNTHNLRGYLVVKGHSSLVLPENLRNLRPGFHELKQDDLLVLVDEQPPGRLYLVFLRSQAERMAFYFGTLPIILTLIAIYLVSWLTYRSSKRLISPVSWLARQVALWDPRRPDVSALAAERLPVEVQGEARQLASALHGLAQRVSAHVARERDFTRDASHELRTPLTVIRVASDMAMAEDSPPRVARALQRIQRAGRDMEAVIDAFLILAREAEVEPQREDFDVADVLLDEADNARALLIGKPVDLEVTCNAKPRLHAPPRVFQVVVSNLLRNACSYTDQGRIDVILEADRVIVRDTGIGMSAESMTRVFEPFYRADPSRPQGSGLGLSIVSRLCDRFGWKVELDSVLGEGTTASIRFVL
ncbi:sensor histidine kinase [Pseudoxanthomonas wuyuanensis]|uniref:histidine kinase n=1 Tax=Pseudoxanthomonas wuyuanensis TaxID=1073196 RepID=A0A286D7S1_9GAMM|nr:HAMP domain-containing sensor histidine kinase [Pseudoxanthomonas wuyuanensis]KAF1720369.1 sensor histidine kinase [Pseudoxanthomonas wuyuanensis]SOD54706.1 Signal transduction histidine kinase [Pseudoxanthomonas wuyuanensis]